MTELDELPLPELPDGYFWRVRRQEVLGWPTDGTLAVAIMHRRQGTELKVTRRFLRNHLFEEVPTETQTEVLSLNVKGTAPIAIQNAANRLVKQFHEQAKVRELMGDYPPKKLTTGGAA